MVGTIHIGTSGWHYKHWLGVFYPPKLPGKEMLGFYSQHFPTVEINNSFYHLPLETTFDQWRQTTPNDFLFAVKGSRFITHMKKLTEPSRSTRRFFAGAHRLKEKLGPILFQLPPRWHLNLARLSEFLEALPAKQQYTFEFRDESWQVAEVYDLLRSHNAAFCIYDLSGKETPLEITADFTYVRFHGPAEARYAGSYSTQALRTWAKRLRDWQKRLKNVYVYFNNDVGGHAIFNAKQLCELVQ
jgi:uncharacterized protein YecE (DUF72 family)